MKDLNLVSSEPYSVRDFTGNLAAQLAKVTIMLKT